MIKFRRMIRFGKMRVIISFLALSLVIGIIAGALAACTMRGQNIKKTSDSLENYICKINNGETSKTLTVFFSSLLKHTKVIIIIWLLAFIKFGGIIVFPAFMLTGARYGFSTALIIKLFGFKGLLYAAMLYLPQSLILIPCYFFVSCASIGFSLTNAGKVRSRAKFSLNLKKYAVKLAIGLSLAILVSGVDVIALNFAKGRL